MAGAVEAPVSLLFFFFLIKRGCFSPAFPKRPCEVDRLGTIIPILQIWKQKFRQINKWHNLRSESQDPEDLGIHPDSSKCRCSVLIRLNDMKIPSLPHSLLMTWLFFEYCSWICIDSFTFVHLFYLPYLFDQHTSLRCLPEIRRANWAIKHNKMGKEGFINYKGK